jgi:putative FmdB family regulatory protein
MQSGYLKSRRLALPIYDCRAMPVYEFECEQCGERFEELTSSDTHSLVCPRCASTRTRRLLSPVSPAGRQPRGAGVRSDESRRRDREAARGERLAESKRKRGKGGL